MKLYVHAAVVLAAALAQPAFAQTTSEAPAVLKARQLRLEVEAKQKQLADARNDAPAPAAPAAPLELTIDETDSPGATQ
jgi:outer membrane protein W